MRTPITWVLLVAVVVSPWSLSAQRMAPIADRVDAAIKRAGVAIVGLTIGDEREKATWRVQPPALQSAAQPTIDAFDPSNPADAQAALEAEVVAALDTERLTASVVWTMLKQMYPTDTDAQTLTKYATARTRIIAAYKAQPWK